MVQYGCHVLNMYMYILYVPTYNSKIEPSKGELCQSGIIILVLEES